MILQLLDGTSFDTSDYNLKRLFHRIPSSQIDHNVVAVEGRSDIILNSQLNNRTISVEFLFETYDIYDFYALRDRLYELFVRTESFYIIFKREPWKRWKVKLANQFELEPSPNMGSFTVEFITENTNAESVYSSIEFVKEWDVNQHAWNGMIDWDSEPPVYSFNTNSFTVQNLGNGIIDPRSNDLEIVLTGDFPSVLSINNNTTGETYAYNRSLTTSDTLTLSNIRTLRNGVSDFVNTNKRLLTLAPGDNNFTVSGGTVSNISFNFRFQYK